jgi:hypothetical protein
LLFEGILRIHPRTTFQSSPGRIYEPRVLLLTWGLSTSNREQAKSYGGCPV